MINILYLIIGAAAGFAAAWFIAKAKFLKPAGLSIGESENLKQELVNLNSELRIKDDRLNLLNDNLIEIKKKLSEKEEQLIIHQKSLVAKDSDLKHLNERLAENKKEVEETHKKDIEDRASIQQKIKDLIETSNKISKEAKDLTSALKGDSKTQGDWGELILESILEKSGLEKNREYFVQQTFKDEYGKNQKPDVIVKFPDNRSVIIDSKVSLTAYERYVASDINEEKEKALNEHILSIKNHIKGLSEKKYHDIPDLNTLDFVMMFLPIEPAFLLAIQKDSDLWNFAYNKGIVLISPTNLIAVLKMVSNFWNNEKQNRNVMEIARQSGALFDKFRGFINDMLDVEKKIDGAKDAHQNAMKKLSTGKDNLVSKVERIKKLGAKTEKELPEDLFEE